MKRLLVGVGNWLMGDDGIGLRVAEEIENRGLAKDFEILQLPDSGLNLLEHFNIETERILIVDAANIGKKPGEFVLFSPGDVLSGKRLRGFSSHEGDLLSVIELGRSLGQPVPDIRILGIEPESVEALPELSPTLQKRFETYVSAAIAELSGS